ncbi:methyltransferase-like protein-like protein 10 [Pseudovirgaria hyperparasitica]|uniref:Protein-lysine N-methyltransferase EFM4 n=1 Tax=Pseudovirgaria hyperparasitica TaxID=470096 RepID=A0A6A6W759_9PEZI|nr:methyltransferase-like protein-like protein 10 [Pseudovirgaria hyperparasitica]KAF2758039.1 methyltransferase-like protein-like protein 10 [Pseudovirgaria hyperparasitica]
MSTPDHLDPSELGTKEYWDATYRRELTNFASDTSDVGTIWFSDSSAEERTLKFLEQLWDEGLLTKEDSMNGDEKQAATSFIDLGAGNGHMLFALREEGWGGKMVGVDYSPEAVQLAQKIEQEERSKGEWTGSEASVIFERWNAITQEPGPWMIPGGFDVAHDKGTFDAISLSEETDEQGRRICEGYRERVENLVRIGGRVIVTSCNWTSDELKCWLAQGQLEAEREVKYPSFRFGGKEGSQICTVCFVRRPK